MDYLTVKWLHIISAALLFGAGIGSTFCLLFAARTRDVPALAAASRYVVFSSWLFTATTMVILPATGYWLMRLGSFSMASLWISWSIVLYVLAIACWLPVAWLQIRMRAIVCEADASSMALPMTYWRYFWMWVALGIPVLFTFAMEFYLMVARPG